MFSHGDAIRRVSLDYGTSNSASNYTPRVVEYLKGKVFVGVAAAKYHTIVLGADGEVCDCWIKIRVLLLGLVVLLLLLLSW